MSRALVTGGGGFLGTHLVARLEAAGHEVFVPRRHDYDLTHWDDAERMYADAQPELHLRPVELRPEHPQPVLHR